MLAAFATAPRCSSPPHAVVDQLRSRGVTFERYDEPQLETDENGIHTHGDGKVAWFKDPDGNTFAAG
ncbi:MAG TPA: hypothetical protein VFI46_00420 [Jiangellaceae bacterium]|nr:hypothetical protein [Jiangellaceae bacterium]